MSRDTSQTSVDVLSIDRLDDTPAELVEPGALVPTSEESWGGSALALQLQHVAQESDPLADALQAELGRESRVAYRKDWRTFNCNGSNPSGQNRICIPYTAFVPNSVLAIPALMLA